jgi:hypothetical protein
MVLHPEEGEGMFSRKPLFTRWHANELNRFPAFMQGMRIPFTQESFECHEGARRFFFFRFVENADKVV